MRIWKLGMAVAAVWMVGLGAWPDAREDDSFTVTLEDGSRIAGVVLLDSVSIETPYGTLTVPFGDVIMIDFGRAGERDKLLAARMPLVGRIALEELAVKSEVLGEVRLTREDVVRLERASGPHRFVGSWVGVAADKEGHGGSRDSLVLDLKLGATGQLEGVASGEFVGRRETKLENVQVKGGVLGFEVHHRTGVQFKIMLELQDEKLRGEGIEPGGGECEFTLERRRPGALRRPGPSAEARPLSRG